MQCSQQDCCCVEARVREGVGQGEQGLVLVARQAVLPQDVMGSGGEGPHGGEVTLLRARTQSQGVLGAGGRGATAGGREGGGMVRLPGLGEVVVETDLVQQLPVRFRVAFALALTGVSTA